MAGSRAPPLSRRRAPARDNLSRALGVCTRSRLHLALTAGKNFNRGRAPSPAHKGFSPSLRQEARTRARPHSGPGIHPQPPTALHGTPHPLLLIGSQQPALGKSQWRAPPSPCWGEGADRPDRTTCRPRGGVGSPPSRWRREEAAHGPARASGGGAPGLSAG